MPDAEKKNQDEQNEPDKKEVQRDSLGNVIEAGPPPLEKEVETEVEKENDAEEPKDVPPDLVPTPKESEESDETGDAEQETEDSESKESEEAEDSESDKPEESEPKAEESETEDTPFDDEKTDKAIDEIVAKEGDDVLAAQDIAAAKGKVDVARKRGHFWRNKWVWYIVLTLLLGGIVAALVVPTSRYWAFNAAGVRSSSSLTVVDSSTQLPLKGVDISLGSKEAQTDSNGKVTFTNVPLGATQLVINQVGFEAIHRDIVIGWGSNPLGNFALRATGVRYVIEVKDYLSGQPLEGVQASNGAANAVSGKDGKITLTLENTVVAKDSITLSKSGYRSDNISLNDDPAKPTRATLVIARKAVFVNKDSGKYDVYTSDIDGKNRDVLLAATGNENSNISLSVSPDGTRAAYVSTRDNKRDSSGFLLSTLILINTDNGNTVTIAESAQIQLIDWVGTRLVFELGSSDSGASDRYSVVSYDYTNNSRVQLAAANKLTAVLSAKGSLYYAVGADDANPSLQLGLFKIAPDGKDKQRVVDTELTSVLRSTYGTLNLQATDGTWLSYDLAGGAKTQIGTPSNLSGRLYTDNNDHAKSVWVSQGALKVYDVAASKDTDVTSLSGLTYPVEWVGTSAVIFRVASASETADYVVSLAGGAPHKIADITPTYGFSQAQ